MVTAKKVTAKKKATAKKAPTRRPGPPTPPLVGQSVLIRTVTLYHIGRIVSIDDKFIRLADASWVADIGRFSTALATGTLNEVERFADDVWVSTGAVIDITPWHHLLPTVTR